jgi:electron transport complex protein RnfG
MAKTESTLINMLLTLLVIAVVAGTSLGYVYKLTKEPIELAIAAKQQTAIKEVVPEYNNDPLAEVETLMSEDGMELKMFPAKKDGQLVGVAIETLTNKGFSGTIKIMVGMKPDGTIINYRVLDHKETPGLGSKMEEWFRPQAVKADDTDQNKGSFFKWLYGIKTGGGRNSSIINTDPGKVKLTVSKDGGDVDAITAATISSRAFLDAIRRAYTTYAKQANISTDAVTGATTKEGGNYHE